MNSERLPENNEKNWWQTIINLVERLNYSKFIDEICIATTNSKDDVFINF